MSPPDPGEAALLDALRPALEAALDHGRALAADGEATAVPGRVAKLLSHTRATVQGLRVVRSVLESDDEFRVAVAASPAAADLDGMAAAWLSRSEGWREACDQVVRSARHAADLAEESEARIAAEGELRVAEERRRDAEDERDRRAAEGARLGERLAESSARVDELRARVDELVAEREVLAAEASSARDRAQRAETTIGEERASVRNLRSDVERLGAEVERLTAALEEERQTVASTGTAPAPVAPFDVDEVRRTVARTAELLGLIDPLRTPAEPPRRTLAPRRRPVRLRRGIVEGTPDGVRALLAADGMTVLIDGYNVTKSAWGSLDLDHQRDRLVGRLDELFALVGGCCDVVFDGADVGPAPRRIGTERVRVSFSDPGMLADDEILDRVGALDPVRHVTVVTSDNEVRDGAARLGANLVHSAELIAAFR